VIAREPAGTERPLEVTAIGRTMTGVPPMMR
jgi:hypothetical protein